MFIAGHDCPLAADVVGIEQVLNFLARYCRVANSTEVGQAGFFYEEASPEENWYLLTRSPPNKITIPGIKGSHTLLGKWTTGTVFLESWIKPVNEH